MKESFSSLNYSIEDETHTSDSNQVEDFDETLASHDSVRIYLNQINKNALLSASEEVEIAKKIEAGLFARKIIEATKNDKNDSDIDFYRELTDERYADLLLISQEGERAKLQMIESNLRLVVSLAKRYVKNDGTGLPLLDMIQDGNIGLIRAVEKFDYKQGNKFSTYATWWIKQFISRGITEKSRMIRFPEKRKNLFNKILAKNQELKDSLGRAATYAELADALDVATDLVEDIMIAAKTPMSLDVPADGEKQFALSEVLERQDPGGDFEELVMKTDAKNYLQSLIESKLSQHESRVVMYWFGLHNGEPMGVGQISEVMGFSRQHITKVKNQAIEKLQSSDELKELCEYISQ